MSQADSRLTTGAPGDDPGHPLLGLARQNAERGDALQSLQTLRREARDEISRLIQFLDQSDEYVMTEVEDDDDREEECEDEGAQCEDEGAASGDDEPSLGSLNHHHSQERWAIGDRRDLELDGAESGIGDIDGLLEQIGPQDWQAGKGGMV